MSDEGLTHSYLAHNLKFLRKKHKISQEKLSSDLGITRNKIASYESRNIEPKLELIIALSEYFHISIDDLIKTPISDENYASMLVKGSQDPKAESKSLEISLNLNKKKAIARFIAENAKIGKIINGFKAFQDIKGNEAEASDVDQLMEVIDYLMETNQNLILEINSTLSEKN